MSLPNLFSRRNRTPPTTITLELLPAFRRACADIIERCVGMLGESGRTTSDIMAIRSFWNTIVEVMRREHPDFPADPSPDIASIAAVTHKNKEMAFDVVEYALRLRMEIDIHGAYKLYGRMFYRATWDGAKLSAAAAMAEFNGRAEEYGVGYRFADSMIINSPSNFTTNRIIDPSLRLLHTAEYEGAHQEFQNAHAHFRSGRFKEAITDAGKAFESVMKTICARKKWHGTKKDGTTVDPKGMQANELIQVLKTNEFFPKFLDNTASDLVNLLGSLSQGPTIVRNKKGAHGQGEEVEDVNRELAEYAIHTAASNILFFVTLATK